jgi:hypothetical protein
MFFLCDVFADCGLKNVNVKGYTRIRNGKVSAVKNFVRKNLINSKFLTDAKSKNGVLDNIYNRSIKRNDTSRLKRLVDVKRFQSGLPTFDAQDPTAYTIRRGKPPTKTIKSYKAFQMKDGDLYPMFVGATDPLPQGVWLDAKAGGYHFTADNGRKYVPAKTGDNIPVPQDPKLINELLEKGVISKKDQKAIKAVAYRPGWHGGEYPIFPQSGNMVAHKGVKKMKNVPDDYFYKTVNYPNTVFAEVEMAADVDYQKMYEQTATRDKTGKIVTNLSGIQDIPKDGAYEYATNPLLKNRPEMGKWNISGSMKINKVLSQKEVDGILDKAGIPKPLWGDNAGLNLNDLGYDPKRTSTGYKLKDAVTYDNQNKPIPLSKRFDKRKKDPRY